MTHTQADQNNTKKDFVSTLAGGLLNMMVTLKTLVKIPTFSYKSRNVGSNCSGTGSISYFSIAQIKAGAIYKLPLLQVSYSS
jgi:hypothetical protein